MKNNQTIWPIEIMARVLLVCVSGFYAWCKSQWRARQLKRLSAYMLVKIADKQTWHSYGYVRLHQHLCNEGVEISQYMVRSIRQENSIYCNKHKHYKITTNSKHNRPVYDNLLQQNFTVAKPNFAWVSDITYIWTDEGWLYLAGVKDLYSKELIGYSMSSRMTVDICLAALNMAIKRRQPQPGLIVHSDRGSQYCSVAYDKLLQIKQFKGSMSAKGNCYDNAPIESFWGTLKNELVHHKHYKTRQEAIKDITKYIEIFYNRIRIQQGLGFKSPAKALADYQEVEDVA